LDGGISQIRKTAPSPREGKKRGESINEHEKIRERKRNGLNEKVEKTITSDHGSGVAGGTPGGRVLTNPEAKSGIPGTHVDKRK